MTQSAGDTLLADIKQLAKKQLKPIVNEIDREDYFPADFMHELGAHGGFAVALPQSQGGLGKSFEQQIELGAVIGQFCGSTAFVFWCQVASAWYLHCTENQAVQEKFLEPVARGKILCGTGMSNTVKHLAGIEKSLLHARRDGDNYIISGILPWVSNIGAGHLITVTAQLDDGQYVMFAMPCDDENITLHDCPEFSGMGGTATYNIRFHDVVLKPENVLAHPEQFFAYIDKIKAGFVLSQTAMALGVIDGSIKTIKKANKNLSHVNIFLDDQIGALKKQVTQLRQAISRLASQVEQHQAPILDILKVRAWASELSLAATQSAALHCGAKGYLMRHEAQRRLREALFVAIVTPALKHLRKEIHSLEQQQAKVG